jgi:hypothetical protein
MRGPCPCRHDANPCDACERRAEAIKDGSRPTPSDRAQRADEQADREERVADERFGRYVW